RDRPPAAVPARRVHPGDGPLPVLDRAPAGRGPRGRPPGPAGRRVPDVVPQGQRRGRGPAEVPLLRRPCRALRGAVHAAREAVTRGRGRGGESGAAGRGNRRRPGRLAGWRTAGQEPAASLGPPKTRSWRPRTPPAASRRWACGAADGASRAAVRTESSPAPASAASSVRAAALSG